MTPDAMVPPFLVAAALLAVAGMTKLIRPRATAQALVDAGLPAGDPVARGLGAAELSVATWAFVAPSSGGAVALAVAYLGFACFVLYVLRARPEASSCGCAGARAVPPSLLHVGLNAAAAAAALALAAGPPVSLVAWMSDLGWAAAFVLGGLAVAAWLAVVVVTEVPAAWHAWVPPRHVDDHHDHGDHHLRADEALIAAGIGPGHPSLWPGMDPSGAGE